MKTLMIIMVAIGLVFHSCHSGSGSINNYNCVEDIVVFVQNQKDSCKHYTEEDWKNANLRFKELLTAANQYKDDLSINDKKRVAQASAQYIFLQVHRGEENLANDFNRYK